MADIRNRGVDDIVEALNHNKQFGKSCALLIGAGCSITAGIPGAKKIVELIHERYSIAYDRAKTKGYAQCMAELSTGQRRDFIRKIISDCKSLNWAHVGMAQLMKARFVDRILTVNFDPLIMKACAVAGEYPAVYDFTARHDYASGRIADRAVFHLHGQHTGFVILNTDEEVRNQAERVKPVIQDTGQNRTLIVVGYSGDNDPVFNELVNLRDYDHGLYWIGFEKEEPAPHVRSLLNRENTFFVPGYDADRFFIELCQRLECFPPSFIGKPFTHLNSVLDTLTEFPLEGKDGIDILQAAKELVTQIVDELESGGTDGKNTKQRQTAIRLHASNLFAGRNFDGLRKLYGDLSPKDAEVSDLTAWSFIVEGSSLSAQAHTKKGAEADALFAAAGERYEKALTIKSDKHEALNNWGNTLSALAETKTGAEADSLFAAAGEKYEKALTIKPEDHEALYNWGIALSAQARAKQSTEADALFAAAGEKYEKALIVKPDKHDALNNWGNALSSRAQIKRDVEAEALFAAAEEKFKKALAIKPDKYEALNNWGASLSARAETKRGAEANALFAAAGEKYEKALAIKPDHHEALSNWGAVLSCQARMKQGVEADMLFAAAGEKYEKALTIKPDKYEALNNWGIALSSQARTKQGNEAEALFAAAGEKYERAVAIRPDDYEALGNWGIALAYQGKALQGPARIELFARAREKTSQAYAINPGATAYNLACIVALQGDPEAAIKYLEESKIAGQLPSREHILNDEDFASIRESAAFQQFLASAFGPGA